MPELPEVETVRRGLEPLVQGRRVVRVDVYQPQLRQPVPADLDLRLKNQKVTRLWRRGKYLLIAIGSETLLLHLGMSGRLRVLDENTARGLHDHIDIHLEGGRTLRFHDPRRFGLVLLCERGSMDHPLLSKIGPEPLETPFNGDYLHRLSRGRKAAIKNFLMDSHVVAGVGNIYASEALFVAGIRPSRAAGRISRIRYANLAWAVRTTLEKAIAAGGTTLRDFIGVDGEAGYFKQQLFVYGRAGESCLRCGSKLKQQRIGQRSSFYCGRCQR
ncbi:MAG: bifunctional DNA-formamidopyrimidine glycosylase/DNA-(apurinic or apyrimidinic site) lyase [Sinobacteraceae bacterium]|nr:bifunctional DNA-formamidopyrimidine glycosylase/DNA-(apurinic or apyrimidinic site) lyase [Nevskiaceae bacterium]